MCGSTLGRSSFSNLRRLFLEKDAWPLKKYTLQKIGDCCSMISFSTASCYNTKNILLDTRGSTPMSQLQANHFSHITLRPYTPKTVKKSAFFSVNYPRPKGHGLATAQSYERHTSPTFNPKRYCYLKWRYIIGWLTTPFTDKICSSVTVSGTKLPMPYSNNVFTIKILRSTRISYCNLISCQCTKECLNEQHIERFSL